MTAAEQEAAEAVDLVGALEEKVRDGDESVTPEELANARELGRFAKLRAEAAARKAEQAKEQARLDAIGALVDEIRASGTDRKQLADALDTFDTALRDVLALSAAHNTKLTQ